MKYSKEIYDKDVLVKAAYSLSDTAYFHLDADEKHYLVEIVPKDPNDSSDYEKRFENVHIPRKQHNRSKGTACCSASNGIKPVNSYCA